MRDLFERYPKVLARVPFEALADLPTPVTEHQGVWVKRDDAIGGSVVRKLEFYHPQGKVLAVGSRDSAWLRALAAHRKVRILTHRDGFLLALRVLGELPRIVGGSVTLAPRGGSDPMTTLGFVNAALELAAQVRRGECPPPDAVFLPLVSGGAAAGLSLGFALAGLDLVLHAVRCAPFAGLRNVHALGTQAAFLLDAPPRFCRVRLEKAVDGLAESEIRNRFAPVRLDPGTSSKAAASLLARRAAYRAPLLWG